MSLLDALLLDPAPFNVWIAYRTDGLKGSGLTPNDPRDGSTQARFDEAMGDAANLFPNQKVAIHLGPGTFTTAGYVEGASNPWQIKAAMKIIGSGREVTIIKRADGTTSGFVLGHDLTAAADYFEMCDLTVDCNLMNSSGGGAACGAVRVMGNHVRLARVRATNWGCSLSGGTCRVFALITANPPNVAAVSNCGLEACIADAPKKLTGNPTNTGTVVMFHAGAPTSAGLQQEGYARSPYIRNCYGQWDATISGTLSCGLSMSWCRGGVVQGNHIHDASYGGPFQQNASALDIIVRNNNYRNVLRGPFWDLGTVYPASPVNLHTLDRDPGDVKIAVATTNSDPNVAHGYQAGERVKITTGATVPSPYDGIFVIKDVPAQNQFRYVMTSDPMSTATAPRKHQKVFGVGRVIVEGNTIALATGATAAIHLHDQKITEDVPSDVFGDAIVRNNKIRYVDGVLFEPTYTGDGVRLNGVTNAIVRDNVVEVAPSNPILLLRCRNVTCQNNRKPSGELIEGYDSDIAEHYGELETDNDFALVMSLFNRRAR